MNKTLWIGIGLLVAVVTIAGYLLYGKGKYSPRTNTGVYTAPQTTVSSPSALPSGPTKTFTVSAKEYGFTPSKISVNKGDHIVITFKNMGSFSHNLTISDLGLATDTLASGQSATLDFVASQTGTFSFICSVDGHKDLGMQGSLEVK